MNCPKVVNFTQMVLQAEFPVSVSWQNLSSCLWLLFNRVPGRLFLELQFFCAVANYGQVGVPDTTGSRLWALIVTQYQCHDMFSLTRVFSPLLCLGWTSIWLYFHLRNGKEHLCHETLSHSKAHLKFFSAHNILFVLCMFTMCVHYTKQCACDHAFVLFLWMVFRLYRLWYGKKQEEQRQTDLPEDIRLTCTQFNKYHKDQCCHDIVKKRR